MNMQKTLVIFALVTVLGLVAVETVDLIISMQEAEAKGCPPGGVAFNAAKGRCFRP
jgi:hypothetical protein